MSKRSELIDKISDLKKWKAKLSARTKPQDPLMSSGPAWVNHSYASDTNKIREINNEIQKLEEELKALAD